MRKSYAQQKIMVEADYRSPWSACARTARASPLIRGEKRELKRAAQPVAQGLCATRIWGTSVA